ncbi:MAG: YggW family oxidoreductase [Gammaproteobacteria bacterium RIFCSPHIGHO2_12_FULL_37_14]|nr:MAG: YggW family oxidoreductase [Gammaproteobacteria bacterium RIFCSPHIGHO2_12_FULL_37_14]
MPIMLTLYPPLGLYIHIPWCKQKCPYCDFNSHEAKDNLPETLYIKSLSHELESHLELVRNRPIVSIFFGGGTPSLFSAHAIAQILDNIQQQLTLSSSIEITLEANPGTIDQVHFHNYRHAGINRLSLGIQSLQDEKLQALGRIHNSKQAMQAIAIAKTAGFDNFNLDLMYGLPQQSVEDALHDLNTALTFQPTHLSWYQLTIEPNTLFYHQRPTLPSDDLLWEMQLAGQAVIEQHGLQQYEVSAYALPKKQCMHNLNYWEFGDYLGIGAGAHSKITDSKTGTVMRFSQVKHPRDYLDARKHSLQNKKMIEKDDLIFEFMLNALRLSNGIPLTLFTARTGIANQEIQPLLNQAKQRGLLLDTPSHICPTILGKRFLNDLIELFLPKKP